MGDTSFEDFDSAPPPEESSNRTFVIVAAILGGIILISVACLAAVYLFGIQGQTAQPDPASGTATAQAANAYINQALTATFQASILPTTTTTFTPTSTSVVAVGTNTPTPDPNLGGTQSPITATVAAALTQAAAAQLTIVPTSTALPNTGFVDDVGIPGLIVMALAFVIVILLARRLRGAPAA
jgi:hypothetical protein